MSGIKTISIGLFVVVLATGVWAGSACLFGGKEPVSETQTKGGPLKQIILLPLGKQLPKSFTESIYQKIKGIVPDVVLYPTEALPQAAYYPARNRYRADSLIAWMARRAGPNQVYAGITRMDISTTKNEFKDWGVMGLGYQPGKACVSSDYLLKKNKSAFWKVVVHELGHTTGLPHCPIKTCFMRDAEGGNPTDEEKEFCPSCKSHLLKSGWKL